MHAPLQVGFRPHDVAAFLEEAREVIGAEWVDASSAKVERYGENLMPDGDVEIAGVVYPCSTEEVSRLVIAANRHNVSLYPVSTGQNIGMGSRAPVMPGQIVMELGRRMNQ